MTTTTKLSPAQEAEVRAACQRVAFDYSFYADNGRPGDLGKLFLDDAQFHLFGQVHVGPAAVTKAMSGNGGGNIVTVHSVSNHRIDVLSDSEATSTAYVTVFAADKSAPAPAAITPFVVGAYHDSYRKTADGWRFAKRAFEPLVTKAS
jgi:hypothetical protein